MTLQRGRIFRLVLFKIIINVQAREWGLLDRDSREQEQERDSWSCSK